MENYLGETIVNQSETPFKDYTPSDWAMEFINRYGQIDGNHHKAWVLDQVARILKGTKVIIKLAKWSDGQSEYRIHTDVPSYEYDLWVKEMLDEFNPDDNEYDYLYDVGIAP